MRENGTTRNQGINSPTVPLSLADVSMLDQVLESYLVYLRGATLLARKHAAQVQVVEGLRRRLAMIPPDTQGTPVLLTFNEVEALDRAVEKYMCIGCSAPLLIRSCTSQTRKASRTLRSTSM